MAKGYDSSQVEDPYLNQGTNGERAHVSGGTGRGTAVVAGGTLNLDGAREPAG